MMSNIVKLGNVERRAFAATQPAATDVEAIRSLSASWRSIAENFQQLQDELDTLRPVLEAFPEGAEKSRVRLQMRTIEAQIRNSLVWSIEASAAVARTEARRASE